MAERGAIPRAVDDGRTVVRARRVPGSVHSAKGEVRLLRGARGVVATYVCGKRRRVVRVENFNAKDGRLRGLGTDGISHSWAGVWAYMGELDRHSRFTSDDLHLWANSQRRPHSEMAKFGTFHVLTTPVSRSLTRALQTARTSDS